MLPGVTPSTSQRRSSPLPTSTVTSFCDADSGNTATLRIGPAARRAPIGERLTSHNTSGIITRMAKNQNRADAL